MYIVPTNNLHVRKDLILGVSEPLHLSIVQFLDKLTKPQSNFNVHVHVHVSTHVHVHTNVR